MDAHEQQGEVSPIRHLRKENSDTKSRNIPRAAGVEPFDTVVSSTHFLRSVDALAASVPMRGNNNLLGNNRWAPAYSQAEEANVRRHQTFRTPAPHHHAGGRSETPSSAVQASIASTRKTLNLNKTPFHKDPDPFQKTPGAQLGPRQHAIVSSNAAFGASASVPARGGNWSYGGRGQQVDDISGQFGQSFQQQSPGSPSQGRLGHSFERGDGLNDASTVMKPADGNQLFQLQHEGRFSQIAQQAQETTSGSSWSRHAMSMSTPIGKRGIDLRGPSEKGVMLNTPSTEIVSSHEKMFDSNKSYPPRKQATPAQGRPDWNQGNAFDFGLTAYGSKNPLGTSASSGSLHSNPSSPTRQPQQQGSGNEDLLAQLKNKFHDDFDTSSGGISSPSINPMTMPVHSSSISTMMNVNAPSFTFSTAPMLPPDMDNSAGFSNRGDSRTGHNNLSAYEFESPLMVRGQTESRHQIRSPSFYQSHPPRQLKGPFDSGKGRLMSQSQRMVATQADGKRSRQPKQKLKPPVPRQSETRVASKGKVNARAGTTASNQRAQFDKSQRAKKRFPVEALPSPPRRNGKKNRDGDLAEMNGAVLVEGNTKRSHKEFYPVFKDKEKMLGVAAAREFARMCVESNEFDYKSSWRIYRSWADLEKRHDYMDEARQLYRKVTEIDPDSKDGWLEYAKMEEESGNLLRCLEILKDGLAHQANRPEKKMIPTQNENLLKQILKIEEKMGNLDGARDLLRSLHSFPINDTWRTILEGALMEGRAGNDAEARRVFGMLMDKVPWSGQIYLEAARLEERQHAYQSALAIVHRGLSEQPRFGHLWFAGFRLNEMIEVDRRMKWFTDACQTWASSIHSADQETRPRLVLTLSATEAVYERAVGDIANELVWKVHFEKAQMFERSAALTAATIFSARKLANVVQNTVTKADTADNDDIRNFIISARSSYDESVKTCPPNLRWKVWLAGARTELLSRYPEMARTFLKRALQEVPQKNRAYVLVETARLEEYVGRDEAARQILADGRRTSQKEWKVFLESVLLEIRNGKRDAAIALAEEALKIHRGTGRLWACLVQLKSIVGPDAQFDILQSALTEVPKSGEVWCEAARLVLNPTSPYFNLRAAKLYLEFAIRYTPQYGDSFLESIRVIILEHVERVLQETASRMREVGVPASNEQIIQLAMPEIKKNSDLAMKDILQLCMNADPNYGMIWFHCKTKPFNTARGVFMNARKSLSAELSSEKLLKVYALAITNQWTEDCETPRDEAEANSADIAKRIKAYSSGRWLSTDRPSGCPPLPDGMVPDDFMTGLVDVNKLMAPKTKNDGAEPQGSNAPTEVFNPTALEPAGKMKLLFGSDNIQIL